MAIEVQSAELIRVIVQFLRENNLNETAKCLQTETIVNLDYIENRSDFKSKVTTGKWDQVLEDLSQLNLSLNILSEVHEQIFNEMLEISEFEAARALLRQGIPLKHLKENNIDRYLKLENVMSQTVLNGEVPVQLRESKQFRRERLSNLILEEVHDVPKSRLMALISSALKWEEHSGNLSKHCSYNILYGIVPSPLSNSSVSDHLDKIPKDCFKTSKLPTGSFIECAEFSPNGSFFVVGTADGYLEVWNPLEGGIRSDLPYQTGENDFMSMKGAISAISFSSDSELLACGSITGEVSVWRLSTGKLVKSFQNVHQNGLTSLTFSPDQQSLLTTGFDNNLHLLGMKSGRILKEFRGHSSYINCAIWIDESTILSGSHDGTLKLWDIQKVECLISTFPKKENVLSPPPIKSISKLLTTESDSLFLVTTQSSSLHVFSFAKREFVQNILIKSISFSSLIRKNLIFNLSTDGILSALKFNPNDSVVVFSSVGTEKISTVEPIGFALNPNLNILVTFDVSGEIKFWK